VGDFLHGDDGKSRSRFEKQIIPLSGSGRDFIITCPYQIRSVCALRIYPIAARQSSLRQSGCSAACAMQIWPFREAKGSRIKQTRERLDACRETSDVCVCPEKGAGQT
jgi:hypothetical protein